MQTFDVRITVDLTDTGQFERRGYASQQLVMPPEAFTAALMGKITASVFNEALTAADKNLEDYRAGLEED